MMLFQRLLLAAAAALVSASPMALQKRNEWDPDGNLELICTYLIYPTCSYISFIPS